MSEQKYTLEMLEERLKKLVNEIELARLEIIECAYHNEGYKSELKAVHDEIAKVEVLCKGVVAFLQRETGTSTIEVITKD